jgi:hypothetical protein
MSDLKFRKAMYQSVGLLVRGHDMKANEPITIKNISNLALVCLAAGLGLVAAVWGVLGIFVI